MDTDSQLVTAVDIRPGNAGDNTGVLELVEQSEENTGIAVEETIGDAAYGDGGTRQAFADAGRTLIAKVPGRPRKDHFPKEDFQIDLAAGACHLPGRAGHPHPTHHGYPDQPVGSDLPGPEFSIRPEGLWRMPPAVQTCVPAGEGKGRTVTLHPQEVLLQQARAFQQSEELRRIPTAGDRWPSIAWLGWSNWESANLATLAGPRPSFSYSWQPRWPT